ncbi:hypothetical protein NDU88_007706 [Pleurodeles waltl]|uniref:Uncharacterized protein n=1 Tax=Pleurodeles waltl TaxID=8319 RepID=A0AAV7ST63_PLEWA|nr:hypothetical protein NDU88_007706 [Pleurodeles waltl]
MQSTTYYLSLALIVHAWRGIASLQTKWDPGSTMVSPAFFLVVHGAGFHRLKRGGDVPEGKEGCKENRLTDYGRTKKRRSKNSARRCPGPRQRDEKAEDQE